MTDINQNPISDTSMEEITTLVNDLASLDSLSQEVSTRQQNVKNIKDGLKTQINTMDTTIKGVLDKVNKLNKQYQTIQNDFSTSIKEAKKTQKAETDEILNSLTTIGDFKAIRDNLQNLSNQTKELNGLLDKGDNDSSLETSADLFNQAEEDAAIASSKAQGAKVAQDAAAVAAAKAAEEADKAKADKEAADAAAAKQKADQEAAQAAAAAKKAQEDKDAAAVGFKDVPAAKPLTPLETALDKLGMDEIKTAKDLIKLEGEALNKAKTAINSLPAKEKSLITRAIENASPGGASNVSAIQNKTKFGLLGGKKKKRKTLKKKKNSKKKKRGFSLKKKKKSIRKK